MKALNEWKGIGRLGKDPESRYLSNGNCMCKISIACDYEYVNAEGIKITETDWIPIVAFGKAAELIAEFATKGTRIYISGRFVQNNWTDDNGVTHYNADIRAKDFIILETKAERRERTQGKTPPPAKPQYSGDAFDDDIPF